MTKGFTIVELLITISIIILITAASAPIYSNYQVSSQLNEDESQIIQTLRIAREQSAARLNNYSHGVIFNDHNFIIFQGSNFGARVADYDREITIEDSVMITTDLPGNEVSFSKGLAIPNVTGTITITHSAGGSRTISLNSKGMVE
jgi:type II secretory pathway pseudopilin PulG